ncbi:MAG: hypothetical protein HBSAPP03_25930 [Phycisphaerae bacterium]|nr:MAG: hypothetical protein HBSAPP03_25930 [Phycisphaerae bacterium]
MHALTKAFVVIAAVLAIALSALVIAYAVNTDRIAADYRNALAQKTAADSAAADANTQAAAEKARLTGANQNLTNALADRENKIRDLEQELAILRTEKMRAEAARQATENQIKELGETAKTQAAIIDTYRAENTTLRQNELANRQRALEMDARIADLESQREVLDQRYRAIMEQFTELKRTADAVASGGTAATGGDQPFTYTGPRINGRIEEVQRDQGGRQYARISVGSNDRVAKNMKFLVIRDNAFLCNLVVTQADMRFSIAVVDTLNRDVSVQAGDLIISKAD